MTSSLATQLAQGASLNSALLIDRSKRKYAESYLFTGKEANHHDLYSVHALALNGFTHLRSVNPAFRTFEQALFSDAAKSVDRTLLTKEKAEELSLTIGKFLRLLGPYLLDAPSGKILEWLVRRFRINEFNIDDALALFLPFHETPHFTKFLSILHAKPQSTWHFLLAYKSAVKGLPRSALVTEMLKNHDLMRFSASLLPEAIKGGYSHRTLINFHTASFVEYISRAESLDSGSAVVFLSNFLEPLENEGLVPKDAILSSFILLSVLAQMSRLTSNATQSILKAIAGSLRHGIEPAQVMTAMISICAPQEKLSKIPRSLVKTLIESPGMAGSLLTALGYTGSEKFLIPLLNPLAGRIKKSAAHELLTAITGSSETPASVLKELARILLESLSSESTMAENKEQLRKLLAQLRQRHSEIFSEASSDVMSKRDEGGRTQIEQLILSLSVTSLDSIPSRGGRGTVADLIIASVDSDPGTRTAAVRGLLEGTGDAKEIGAALLSRTIDTSSTVLETLYSKPSALLPHLEKGYLEAVATVLSSPTTPRQLIRIHVTFLCHHFVKTYPATIKIVVERCLWPFLLLTKARQKASAAVWDILDSEDCSDDLNEFQLLRGCLVLIRDLEENFVATQDEGDPDSGLQKLAAIDIALAGRIADNIMLSENPSDHVDFILGVLNDTSPNTRTLGYLVTRALLGKLSGQHQLSVAQRSIQAMAIETLSGMEDFMKGSDNLQSFISDASLAFCVVHKPGSKTTLNRLKVAVLTLIPTIPRPANSRINWLNYVSRPDEDTRGSQYVTLMATIYVLANAASALPLLSAYLLRALFITLKDDALIFLAGVWTSASKDPLAETRAQTQLAALAHASAFLVAHETAQETIDFQTIVPSILAVFESPNQSVRAAAVQCLSALGRLGQAGKPKAVYVFNTVYGIHSDQLQFLDWVDFQRYTLALVGHGDHLANDVGYLPAFYQQHLTKHKSDSKKDSGFKHRVICYLISHAVACPLPQVRASILKSLRDVPDASKASMLIPIYKQLFGASEKVESPVTADQEFLVALARAFDKNAAKALNDKEGALWQIFVEVLRVCLTRGSQYSLNVVFEETLRGGLFIKLSFERKIELCQLLLDLGGMAEAITRCKNMLNLALGDQTLLLHLLQILQPVVNETAAPVTKKARLDGQQNGPSFTADKLQPLTLLIEVIGANQAFSGTKDLVIRLLDTLDKVVHCTGASLGQSDVTYLEQLLMSVIGDLADRLPSDSVSPTDIKFDVLIQVIRLSDNPQTFHQALLLISSLAHLAPEAVLRNVMPIFTFMGSSVLHRDDEYSFKVVQKTIDSVLPVMTSSLQSKHASTIGLHVAMRGFLSIFTDAANHIPRHRRISFFVHLTEVLGGAEFLAPISMLLVEKVAGRVVRQSQTDAQASLSIPLSILHHYGSATQAQTLKDIVQESGRILAHAFDLEITEPTFLDLTRNDEDSPSFIAAKRRSHALLLFVNYALRQTKPSMEGRTSGILPLLLQISTVAGAHSDEKQATEIESTARTCLSSVLSVIPAAEFVSCATTLLTMTEDRKTKSGALELLAERVPKLSDEVRISSSSSVLRILETIQSCLAADEENVQSGLKALDSLARTSAPGEENAFAKLIPTVLPLIHGESHGENAMDALSAICTKLGPRIIPNLKAIILECTRLIDSEIQGGTPGSSISIKALRVLQGLLSTIPSFWTAEDINLVVDLYLLHDVATETVVMANLVKAAAKRVPSSVLIPTLCDTWKRLKESSKTTSFGAFFLLLKKAIHAAPRGELLHQLRVLFNLFLDGFATQGNEETSDEEAEHETISAFLELVVKLNETTFKPLFRKLYDWAFTRESDERKRAIFCRVYNALLDYFKSLMTPYMSFMIQAFTDLLESFVKSEEPDPELWSSLVQVLGKSFEVDEAAFWREDRLKQISTPLISQIPIVCNSFTGIEDDSTRKSLLTNSLCALAGAVSEDYDERGGGSGGILLKSLNLGILMKTRSEDAGQRIFSVQCATELWKTNGMKLVGFVTEASTFIAELAEDDNDTVVKETRRLKMAVEDVGGPIDGL